jgi:iron complex transport system ATP-binding protein
MRVLTERGFRVSAGVLHAADSDQETAERLDLVRVSVPAFSTIDDDSAAACLALMRDAELIVVCDVPFGPGNVRNLELASAVASEGVRIVLLGQIPIEERDFTGGRATELWRSLEATAIRASSYDEVMSAVS